MEKIKKIIPVMMLLVSIFFVFGQNSKAEATDIYVGNYPESGIPAYLMSETMNINYANHSFTCTVICIVNHSDYCINYDFYVYNGKWYFRNSDGYSGVVSKNYTPVEYNIVQKVY